MTTAPDEPVHRPVLMKEVLDLLAPVPGGRYCDATVGYGGHARAVLEASAPDGRLFGIDRDEQALAEARRNLAEFGDRVTLVHAPFSRIGEVLEQVGGLPLDGCLADLGVSSPQLDRVERGFSFRRSGPLDMRMDQSRGPSVADLLRDVEETELADVIYRFGEERASRRVARAIVYARRESPIDTTGRLAAIVRRAVPHKGHQRIDPATRTFQALRIWVNRELDGLDAFLERAARRLLASARLAMITFHSLEDRIVKHTFRAMDKAGEGLRILTRRPLVPADEEVARNPRARSAKLRAIERCA